jgi:hypothetical protein
MSRSFEEYPLSERVSDGFKAVGISVAGGLVVLIVVLGIVAIGEGVLTWLS